MGGRSFITHATGVSARQAFDQATKDAREEWGNNGYTGTIAEKDEFVMISIPPGNDAEYYAQFLIDKQDERINDINGPAGCFNLEHGRYVFFGWARE